MSDAPLEKAETTALKYKKPKILVVDLPQALTERLKGLGYNARSGSFGRPYKVIRSDIFLPVIVKPCLPNYSEQETIILDLAAPEAADGPEGAKITSLGDLDWYAPASAGVIDPRPRAMACVKSSFDRILGSGGAFVIFAEARDNQDIVLARVANEVFPDLRISEKIDEDNWSLLSILSSHHLVVVSDQGSEIKVNEGLGVLSSFLRRHLENAMFSATIRPLFHLTEDGKGPVFFPLAANKFGDNIAAVLWPRKKGDGMVFILPQLDDKEGAVIDLVQTVLPDILPRLFPDHEGSRWIHRDEYEHSSILERKTAQLEFQSKANEEIARLDKEIEAERGHLDFLHGLLTKSSHQLVLDVKRALEFIGFSEVINVDESNPTETNNESNKQEDLQVLDKSPSIVLEIKGLAGMPTEGDTLQVTKYVLRRMRQWNRTDVIGLSVVNHQRNLPAMERDHKNAFTVQQVEDAKHNGTGLVTTWDLFRLIRGMLEWHWPKQAIKDLLYGSGRLPQFPTHYTQIGNVSHYFTNIAVISIEISSQSLRVGDRVGYLLDEGFFEEKVTSLEVDHNPVQEVQTNQCAGMKTKLTRREIPKGTKVFRLGSGD